MTGPPPRPASWEEHIANRLLFAFAPSLPRIPAADPPVSLAPWEHVTFPRADGGVTAGTWYPAAGDARGVVVLGPPWTEWGRAYFHRRGRIEALRAAGYSALSFDLGGFGGSTLAPRFRDLDAEAALREAARRAKRCPVHAWGVSSGGVWLHVAQARTRTAQGAVFEDVTPHLLEWRGHVTPASRVAHAIYRAAFPRADRFLDLRDHAPHMGLRACAYVVGGADPGIPERSARDLAALAGARLFTVPGAGHLQAIKVAQTDVVGLALATFERAETGG